MASARSNTEVRDGFAHPDAGDLRNDVVQALDVLDVDGRIDVDAVGEDFLDIEIALGMPAAGRVGVGEFVDQHDLGMARDDRVEVHLLDRLAPIGHRFAGEDRQPLEQGFGLLAPVGLDDARRSHRRRPCAWRGPAGASRRSCRRRERRRRICAAGRHRPARAGQPPAARPGEGRCSGSCRWSAIEDQLAFLTPSPLRVRWPFGKGRLLCLLPACGEEVGALPPQCKSVSPTPTLPRRRGGRQTFTWREPDRAQD